MIRAIDGKNMSQTATFLTDFLFPGLLIGCGCLGLGVVNAIGHRPAESRPYGARVAKAPARARPVKLASPAPRPQPRIARPRVASLRSEVRPSRHRLGFGRARTQVSDVERERLRVFLATAKPRPGRRVTVVGHGAGKLEQRRAKRRAEAVVALLKQLGVAAASLAEPPVVPDASGADGHAVTIVVGKRN